MTTDIGMHSRRITRSTAGLLVVDIQERLVPAMFEKERMVENAARLVRGSQALGLPVWITEQYRKGLGATVAEVAVALKGVVPIEKTTFSACGAPAVLDALGSRAITDVILCGIEAHVCVTQTCLDLLAKGYRAFVVADATGSRAAANHQAGLDRMRDAGAVIVSTEMTLFEMLERAGTDEFKQILSIVK